MRDSWKRGGINAFYVGMKTRTVYEDVRFAWTMETVQAPEATVGSEAFVSSPGLPIIGTVTRLASSEMVNSEPTGSSVSLHPRWRRNGKRHNATHTAAMMRTHHLFQELEGAGLSPRGTIRRKVARGVRAGRVARII